jgi:predicted TIM-barrel fold metal-dependent hydrolase
MPILAEPKIDSHCHVIDPARFPYAAGTRYRPSGQEIAPVDHLLRTMELHGVRHALVVGTNSGYGEDLSPVLDALAESDGRFKGVAVVANDIGAAELARLQAQGMVGVAFNVPFHGAAHYAGTGDLMRKLADMNMFLQLQVKEDQLLAFMEPIERAQVRLVVDHCGRPAPERGPEQPGFQALLALGRAGRAAVKLSGFSQFSRERYPYGDARPFIHALLDAFTPDACVWGSDWPFLRAAERIDYGPLLLLADAILPDGSDRRKVLWETPRRQFGFGA